MQAEVPVTSRERISALPVVIKTSGTRDQNFTPGLFRIVDSFEQIPPSSVFMNFVQQDQRFISRKLRSSQSRRNTGMIPIEIGRMRFIGVLAQETQCKSGLADLPRPPNKYHLPLQSFQHGGFQITAGMH